MKKMIIGSKMMANRILASDTQKIDRVVSIGDPFEEGPESLLRPGGRVILRLEFNDIDSGGNMDAKQVDDINAGKIIVPSEEEIEKIIDAHSVLMSGSGALLIHCYAGQSRSPAVAFILAAMELGAGKESEALNHVVQASELGKLVKPNVRMIKIADVLLPDLNLVDALSSWERTRILLP